MDRGTTAPAAGVRIVLPENVDGLDQDAEWCEVEDAAGRRRIRFHDYADIFAVPGLYEQLFYEHLECCSPAVVTGLLAGVVAARDGRMAGLRVLDVGAGNGMVGEELREAGAGMVVGVDILPAAAEATERDRPGVYDDYHVVDLTAPPPAAHRRLSEGRFNCLTTVAALGFGDMPPQAFARAFDYLADGALVAFTLKDRFADETADESGFSRLLRKLSVGGRLVEVESVRYRHRLSVTGEPLHYVAMVAEKRGSATDVLRRDDDGRFSG